MLLGPPGAGKTGIALGLLLNELDNGYRCQLIQTATRAEQCFNNFENCMLTMALYATYTAMHGTECRSICGGSMIMRSVILSVVLASTSVLALAADNAPVSGKWNVHSSIAGNENDTVCTFTQKDADLAGTCKTDSGEAKATGKVDGTKITWSYDSEYNGSPLTVKYSGTFDSATNKISGTVSVEQFGVEGDFAATAAK